MSADRLVHTHTYGPTGSYPKALCGYPGAGTNHRMTSCSPSLLPTHPSACPECLASLAKDTP